MENILELICAAINDCDNAQMKQTSETLRAALADLEKVNKEESKSYFFLKDLAEGCVDAVIIAKTSTAEDIKEAIMKAKENPEYKWEDLVNALPDDCEIVDKWSGIEEIYY